MFDYKPYIKSLCNFLAKEGLQVKPFPKIKLINEKMEGVFVPTANYNPDEKIVNLYIEGRHPKDVLRSLAHEMIHHMQNISGDDNMNNYEGDKISEGNNALMRLEMEAYLKGNIYFRRWTEKMQKNRRIKMKRINESQLRAMVAESVKKVLCEMLDNKPYEYYDDCTKMDADLVQRLSGWDEWADNEYHIMQNLLDNGTISIISKEQFLSMLAPYDRKNIEYQGLYPNVNDMSYFALNNKYDALFAYCEKNDVHYFYAH